MDHPALIVTGGSGLIGSAFLDTARPGFRIRNLDITEGIDITDPAQIERAMDETPGARGVVHLAAYVDVSGAHRQNGDRNGACYRLNVEATRLVARACSARNLPLIHLSTDFVFDGAGEEPYDENSAPNPIEWYGATKRMAEEVVMAAGGAWTIVRIAFPYTGRPARKLDLVRTLRDKLAAGEAVKAFDDQVITPTWLDDVAQGLKLLAEHPAPGEIFHLVGSESITPYRLALKIAQAYGFDPCKIEIGSLSEYLKIDPRPRQPCLRLSNAKWTSFALENGLNRPLTVDEGLEEMRVEQ